MKVITSILFILILTTSCSDDSSIEPSEEFNTQVMLSDITDELLLPSINNFYTSSINLNTAVENYIDLPTENNLLEIRSKWKMAANDYAKVYAFNIGEAKDELFNKKLYNWPTNGNSIENFIENEQEINENSIEGISTKYYTLSGIGYLIFNHSISETHDEFITSNKRLEYLKYISLYHKQQALELVNLWNISGNNYANTFMNNTETGLHSSLNKLFNGVYNVISTVKITKIGKSAGLENSDNVNFDELQARYSGFSKELIIKNLEISKEVFFNEQGLGLSDNISAVTGDEVLNNILKTKFNTAINSLKNLNGSLAQAITNSPDDVRIIHEQLQEIIVLLAIDVRSALSIIITSTDNDGD
jgi:predicted lipoprotein